MKRIEKILKKDIDSLINNKSIWEHEFLACSKNRLFSLSKNPDSSPDDLVLLLAYLNDELVGYMGIYINKIRINDAVEKIGWLSTWWVHPKTKGTGIGLDIFNTMYESNDGKIGISQFTDSAKRVYDKSGYFNELKYDDGLKSVLRSNLVSFLPNRFPKLNFPILLKFFDNIINSFLNFRLKFIRKKILNNLKGVNIEYLTNIDDETMQVITDNSKNDLAVYDKNYFNWLKAYKWIDRASIIELTNKNKYEFSIYDHDYEISFLKINLNNICIGFIVLQKRNYLQKVIFSYYDKSKYTEIISDVISLQLINENTREIICFDNKICEEFLKSKLFLFNSKKQKKSIISKKYLQSNFDSNYMHFGDGDCCFA